MITNRILKKSWLKRVIDRWSGVVLVCPGDQLFFFFSINEENSAKYLELKSLTWFSFALEPQIVLLVREEKRITVPWNWLSWMLVTVDEWKIPLASVEIQCEYKIRQRKFYYEYLSNKNCMKWILLVMVHSDIMSEYLKLS